MNFQLNISRSMLRKVNICQILICDKTFYPFFHVLLNFVIFCHHKFFFADILLTCQVQIVSGHVCLLIFLHFHFITGSRVKQIEKGKRCDLWRRSPIYKIFRNKKVSCYKVWGHNSNRFNVGLFSLMYNVGLAAV